MSSFWGSSFIFNGINSELYDLRIYDFSPSNPSTNPAGGEVSIYEKWLYKRETPYYYGRYYQNPLEFDFTVGSYSYIDVATRNAIESWLTGQSTYLPLRIVQDDMSIIVYNIIITQSSHVYIGNMNYALTLHARCDRPWGLHYPPLLSINYSSDTVSQTITYLNESSFSGYNKPTITFTMNSSGGSFSITNQSENNRVFSFTDLIAGEKITVDNDKGIISSSTGLFRMENFNKNFLRLIQGKNILNLAGNISQFTLSAVFPKGVGA